MKMLWTLSVLVAMTNSVTVFAEVDATADSQSYVARPALNPIGVFKKASALAPLTEEGMYGSIGPRARKGQASELGRTLDGEDCEIFVSNMLVDGNPDFRSIELSVVVYKASKKIQGVDYRDVKENIYSEIWLDKDAQKFVGKMVDNNLRTITLNEASSDSRGLSLETAEEVEGEKATRNKVSIETKGSHITSATGQSDDKKEVKCIIGNPSA